MIIGCKKRGDYWMNIDSPDFIHWPTLRGYLETLKHELSFFSGLKKNSLWMLRHEASKLLRQEDTAYTGFTLRRDANLSAGGSSASMVPYVRESEEREAGLGFGQPVLHKEVCLCSGTEMPEYDRAGCGKGIQAGLAYGKRVGQTVHAGATSESAEPCSGNDRNRRSVAEKRAYVSDSGKRLGEAAAHMVWRGRSFGGEHGQVLSGAWP